MILQLYIDFVLLSSNCECDCVHVLGKSAYNVCYLYVSQITRIQVQTATYIYIALAFKQHCRLLGLCMYVSWNWAGRRRLGVFLDPSLILQGNPVCPALLHTHTHTLHICILCSHTHIPYLHSLSLHTRTHTHTQHIQSSALLNPSPVN